MDRVEEYLNAAGVAFAAGNMPEAKRMVNAALNEPSQWPMNGHALFSAGILASTTGEPASAESYFREYIAAAGQIGFTGEKLGHAYHNLGLALRHQGRYAEAVEAYRSAADIATGAARQGAMINLAWAACLMGDGAMADSALEAANVTAAGGALWHHAQVGRLFVDQLNGLNVTTACHTMANDLTVPADVQAQARWLAARSVSANLQPARFVMTATADA